MTPEEQSRRVREKKQAQKKQEKKIAQVVNEARKKLRQWDCME